MMAETSLYYVGAQRPWPQNRMPEVYREQSVTKQQLSAGEAFLRFLDMMDEQAKLERAERARIIDQKPSEVVRGSCM